MKRLLILLIVPLMVLTSCTKKPKWEFVETISLGDIAPIGIAVDEAGNWWLSDGENNKVVKTNSQGEVLETIEGFERPMHIDLANDKLYVPEYINDRITVLENGRSDTLSIAEEMDAPAGIAVSGTNVAIADFYNHRVIYQQGEQVMIIGEKGEELGQFHYPTDVQILGDKLFVADTYNHRIQVFDEQGNFLKVMGKEHQMNATTGIYVTSELIVATDFEHSRVLTFSHAGELYFTNFKELDKPSDAFVHGDQLLVANFAGKSVSVFKKAWWYD